MPSSPTASRMSEDDRPEDAAYDNACEEIAENYDKVWGICKENRDGCEYARWIGVGEFGMCLKQSVHATGRLGTFDEVMDCPFVIAEVDRRADSILWDEE